MTRDDSFLIVGLSKEISCEITRWQWLINIVWLMALKWEFSYIFCHELIIFYYPTDQFKSECEHSFHRYCMGLICQCSTESENEWVCGINMFLFKPQNRVTYKTSELDGHQYILSNFKDLCHKMYFYNCHWLNGCQPQFDHFYSLTVRYEPHYNDHA